MVAGLYRKKIRKSFHYFVAKGNILFIFMSDGAKSSATAEYRFLYLAEGRLGILSTSLICSKNIESTSDSRRIYISLNSFRMI
ncbi:MAG: hypothetical protein C4291_02965 [Candidatus Dadabacteria bacterium]